MIKIGDIYRTKVKEVVLHDSVTRFEMTIKENDIITVVGFSSDSYIVLFDNRKFTLWFDCYDGYSFYSFFEKIEIHNK